MTLPNKTQSRILNALTLMSLDAGRIELSLLTGVAGAALEKSIDVCKRNGWIGEDGMTSDSGSNALLCASFSVALKEQSRCASPNTAKAEGHE